MQYTATISPNEKYRFVVEGLPPEDDDADCGCGPRGACDECGGHKWDDHEYAAASNAYIDALSDPTDPPDGEIRNTPLSWADFAVASDPDLVSKVATYFDGVESDEPADLIAAKLRLLPCEMYANAQTASQAEIRRVAESLTIDSTASSSVSYTTDTSG